MHDVHLELLQQGIALHKEKQFGQAYEIYNRLLNRFPFSEDLLYLMADVDLRREFNGLAINLLCNLLQNNPKHAAAWCNLGAAFRKENSFERAQQAWMKALDLQGDTVEVCNNMATLYADSAQPEKALAWIERSLAIEPENVAGRWQKALALLTMKQWDEGWKFYESRQELEHWDSRKSVVAPMWDGSHVGSLYIHGEQGVGDEIMFASCLPFVKARHVTVEVHAKVAPIIQKSFPDFDVVLQESPGDYDAKIPIASLMGRYGFNTTPYLNPDPWRVKFYRDELKKLGPGPYLALAWFGGMKQTRCEDRSMMLSELKPLMDAYTCVSGQYSDNNPMIESEREKCGLAKITEESTGLDLHEQAALFKAVDAVVTVQQTAVHVAGGVGAKTFAMIGAQPHWRYGTEGDSLPFYRDVRLYRRKTDWAEVIERVKHALDRELQRTERAVA